MRGKHKGMGDTVPAEPFRAWLRETFPTVAQASLETRLGEEQVRKLWNGRKQTVNLDTVDRALLDQWETLDDLYPLEQAA